MLNNATGFKHIYIATGYTDLRKSIDGLAMLISTEFKLNPYDEGSIFLFCGKRNDRIKALVFEGDGFLLMYKRLADGKYKWPRSIPFLYNGERAFILPHLYHADYRIEILHGFHAAFP